MASPAVIVPTHNRASELAGLLSSLQQQTIEHDVVVVDNASSDGTRALVAERFPYVRTLELPENAGFGRAINRAVASIETDTIVLVNDDAVCLPRFLEALCTVLDPKNRVVMAAGVLLDSADPARIDSCGILFDRTLFGLDYLHGEAISALEEDLAGPIGPSGGAAAFDRAAFDAVGGFDEHFFAYLEDVDLAARLIAQGGRCRLAIGAQALHAGSATLGSGSRRKNELMGWSRGYTIGKYRLYRNPRLLGRALLDEAVIVSGQAVIDRTLVGGPARLAGFRAGLRVPAERLPKLPAAAKEISVLDGLRYRFSRRSPGRHRT